MDATRWIRAFYMDERIASRPVDPDAFSQRMKYWEMLTGGSREKLETCIQGVSGFPVDRLAGLAGAEAIRQEAVAEDTWFPGFQKWLSGAYDRVVLPPETGTDIPFFGFFEPFLKLGLGALHERFPHANRLSQPVVRSLLGQLAHRLFEVAHATLILELNVARVSEKLSGDTPEERYRHFSEVLLRDEQTRLSLYNEYPVLVRLAVTKTLHWVSHVSELLERIEADRDLLSQRFHSGHDIGVPEEIDLGLGDSHNKGRGVAMVRFSGGLRVIYKPRPMGVDIGFQDLLRWLNREMAGEEPFRILNVVDRKTYGWSEFVEKLDCRTEEELVRFYRRMGRLLALLYLLQAVDFHHENLIAHGEHPVLVDLESLFHQTLGRKEYTGNATDRAEEILQRSVRSTGLLPAPLYYRGNPGAGGVDVSGIGAGGEQTAPFKLPYIENKNTDRMRMVNDYGKISAANNRPTLRGSEVKLSVYLPVLEQGFEEMYRWVMEHGESFKERLYRFSDVQVRSILRSTMQYGNLLRQSVHPDFLRDGIDRDVLLHRLWLDTDTMPSLKAVVRSEKRDLTEGDIPFFHTRPGERHVRDSEGRRLDCEFPVSALEDVFQKIDALSPEDCRNQLQVVRMSILAGEARHDADVAAVDPRMKVPGPLPEKDEFLREAEKIGDYLLSKAISGFDEETGEEDATWISTTLEGTGEILWQISPVGNDLYNGNSGIALFLAFLSELTGRSDFREAAAKALVPVRKAVRKFGEHPGWSIGPFNGAGGYLHAMNLLAALWKDEALRNEVERGLDGFLKMIPQDRLYDFIGGSAGALFVLLGIHRRTGNRLALEGAGLCAEHLLKHAERAETGIGWRLPWEKAPYTGFAHGVSGVACALFEWYRLSGDDRFKEAVSQALEYERSFFDEAAGNWKTPGRDTPSVAWCHGAPGILLGRLMLKRSGFEDERLEEELGIALETTLNRGFGNNRSLCHGDFGQIGILRFASEVLGDGRLSQWADSAAAQVLNVIREQGFRCGVSRGVEAAGLMVGLAGIGYGLMMQSAPSRIPFILRLES
ncbi:type 2 lanthipeptide synthetase LanM family protein [Staphylospora marina]|uniref:type 2 lanthipeptide synthetase LanM family protein n=1 Tax=Staphylospora marina TaxID=2490858 RepID=UPI0013DE3A4F|nr:type 2 lanthipeptide synthetase LanM family protein [Staphylospora marina]